jgi:hypothetical protein
LEIFHNRCIRLWGGFAGKIFSPKDASGKPYAPILKSHNRFRHCCTAEERLGILAVDPEVLGSIRGAEW